MPNIKNNITNCNTDQKHGVGFTILVLKELKVYVSASPVIRTKPLGEKEVMRRE